MFCFVGVFWSDMHLLANKVMLQELKKIDLVRGDVDEMIEVSFCRFCTSIEFCPYSELVLQFF